jgi:carbon-monoxide dehydrogenase medium subunit
MHPFDYQKVFTLNEAFESVSNSEGAAVFIAGGTDVLVRIKKGGLRPLRVIDMKGIPGMDGFSISGNRFSIGALTRIRLWKPPEVMQKLPPGAGRGKARFGSGEKQGDARRQPVQRGTFRETAPALLALDACAEIYGERGGQGR